MRNKTPTTPEEIIKHCMLQPLGRRARTAQEAKTTTRLTVIVNEDTEVGIDVLQLIHDYELELNVAQVCNKEFPELCAWDEIQRNDGLYITTRKLKS